jgi:carboxylesterase type B
MEWIRILVLSSFVLATVLPLTRGAEDTDHRPVRVTIPSYGKISGIRKEGLDFFGNLPFAAPPVGNLRFAPPEPPPPWAPAILDASNYGPDCWQVQDPVLNPSPNEMSEDCLTLNIFTPAGQVHSKKPLPVMVWLHGGAFQQGGANRPEYDGRRLAERDLVVVTANYRVGALGFLVSSSDNLYGNFGLMDQRAALDWIQSNIRVFGGDPGQITLMGESAGAIMISLHLMMEGAGKLFHRVVMQSNALGYTFRSTTIADFIGAAFKTVVDCRDLACLRSERVEDLLKAQSSLMGVPRSVGDFFTWAPTLTQYPLVTLKATGPKFTRVDHRMTFLNRETQQDSIWAVVNVSQPLKGLDRIPEDMEIMIGSNKHEGELFVYTAFPAPMPKAVYWMFVGALFRDSASRVLKHYRGYVDEIEAAAQELAKKQLEEEENHQFYLEHKEQLDQEYELLLAMNATRKSTTRVQGGVEALVETWSRGGAQYFGEFLLKANSTWQNRLWPFPERLPPEEAAEKAAEKAKIREERRIERKKQHALKEAAKVVVDYRPVMSRIIDDYLFRCPTWQYANLVSQNRAKRGKEDKNVYVYRFSQPTHIPGFKACWGKSCHTAELPYPFESMDAIRSTYSTLGPIGRKDAPAAPVYPYTDILAAYRGALLAYESNTWMDGTGIEAEESEHNSTYTFNRILTHFFGDYFLEDADEELASDMSERWAAFTKSGDPNYESSKAKWRPWRYNAGPDMDEKKDISLEDTQWIFDIDPHELDETDDEQSIWPHTKEEQIYRKRALAALNMDVADEDVFRTELRRVVSGDNDVDKAFLASRFLFRSSLHWDHGKHESLSGVARDVMRFAQEMGVLGTGMGVDDKWHYQQGWEDNDFFPEFIDFKWPPEGRLIERDCTCDMWQNIRCKYCFEGEYNGPRKRSLPNSAGHSLALPVSCSTDRY